MTNRYGALRSPRIRVHLRSFFGPSRTIMLFNFEQTKRAFRGNMWYAMLSSAGCRPIASELRSRYDACKLSLTLTYAR